VNRARLYAQISAAKGMELLQQALSEHEDKLAKLRVNADNLHDALSRGENLRNVVALSRNLRQELAYTHEYFQACGPFPASICLVCRPPRQTASLWSRKKHFNQRVLPAVIHLPLRPVVGD